MRSDATAAFMAAMAVAQHHGRPHTPTGQAWIEPLFGHVKGERPHLERIDAPALLEHELDRVRHEYNSVRLHAGLHYVTPNDEHEGRADAVREARRLGLERARQERIAYHRRNTTTTGEPGQ
jgi:putative transposase